MIISIFNHSLVGFLFCDFLFFCFDLGLDLDLGISYISYISSIFSYPFVFLFFYSIVFSPPSIASKYSIN